MRGLLDDEAELAFEHMQLQSSVTHNQPISVAHASTPMYVAHSFVFGQPMPRELDVIADALIEGRAVEPVTVRTFLGWFDAQRRGWRVTTKIREALAEKDIRTVPDFETQWIDAPISVALNDKEKPDQSPREMTAESEQQAVATEIDPATATMSTELLMTWVSRDATYRISRLTPANSGVEAVPLDAPLTKAITMMMNKDYSQLPVMSGKVQVKGMITWKSIGSRLALGKELKTVQDCLDSAYEVPSNTSIFDAIALIVRHGFVLVRDDKNAISGIVTASDLSVQFQGLTEPFLLLSEIENLIRNMIGDRFSLPQLIEARDPADTSRAVESVDDLTFGEYIRLLDHPERWKILKMNIDREFFCKELNQVRGIRNDVMHFDPDGIEPKDLNTLRSFKSFLKSLADIHTK